MKKRLMLVVLMFITRWVNTPLLATVQRVITGNPPGNSRNTPQLAAVGIASFRISVFILVVSIFVSAQEDCGFFCKAVQMFTGKGVVVGWYE